MGYQGTIPTSSRSGRLAYVTEKDYSFQAEDVEKLKDRKGRLNASQMGTGKTYMGAELDLETDTTGATLVVSPLGNFDNWKERFEDRNVPVYEVDPKDRDGSFRRFRNAKVPQGHKVFIAHWQALRLMPALSVVSREKPFGHIIADEVHRMQGRKTKQTRALKAIRANFRTGLSGTPVTASPAGYWSVLNWLYPDQYTSFWKFFDQFVDFELQYTANGAYKKVKGVKDEDLLLKQIEPYYVRHLKREQCCPWHPEGVMPWLPDKYYSTKWVDLTPQQRKAYHSMEKDMLSWVGTHEDEPLAAGAAIAQLTRLQQFAMAYATIDDGKIRLAEPSSKLDAVYEILEEALDNGEALVIFSQFSQAISLLAERMRKMGSKVKWGTYTGQNRSEREGVKRAFANGDLDVFAGTIQAGGEAIDGLQNYCSTMVFLDRTWSSSANNQAEDRLDRDGQTKPVHIIDIMARNTVDLGRRQKLINQWAWIRKMLGDEKGRIQDEVTQGR